MQSCISLNNSAYALNLVFKYLNYIIIIRIQYLNSFMV